MDYRLELLDESKFENLTVTICSKVLGTGVVQFAAGKDGGRDGKFVGTASRYPSDKSPWSGKFIIQAKHTANPIASCADAEFERLIKTEIPKIKKLRLSNDIDNYIIFTNRKYSGVSGEKLLKYIHSETDLENVAIIGKETLNNQYINPYKDIINQFDLNKHHMPFDFSDEEIKDIILGFKNHLNKIESDVQSKSHQLQYDFDHLDKSRKNELNKLGEEYYQKVILEMSLMDFGKLQNFLDLEINSELCDYYFDVAAELRGVIVINRGNFGAFEEIFNFIYKKICDGATDFKGSKRHVWTFLHYMYFECLIGDK